MAPSNAQDPARLLARARLLYEVGGLRLGIRTAWPVLPLVLVSLGCCGSQYLTPALGVILFLCSVGFVSASHEMGRAVRFGLKAGSLCAAFPMAFKLMHLCSWIGCRPMSQVCLYGGLLCGAVLGYRAGLLESGRPRFLVLAGSIAALAGTIGCTVAGLAGVLGMALGVLSASAPFLWVARAR